jgi:hypothetical protein
MLRLAGFQEIELRGRVRGPAAERGRQLVVFLARA